MNDQTTQSKDKVSLFIASLVFIISGYLTNLLLGKYLGPVDYGLYGIVISLMTAINIIQTSGLPQATSKFISSRTYSEEEILKASLLLQFISTAIISFVFFIFAHPFAKILNDISLTPYIQASSLILPFYAMFSLYVGYYNGLQNFKKQASLNIIYSVAKLVSIIALVLVFHLYGAIIGFIVSPIVALLFGFTLPKNVPVPKSIYTSLITFSIPLIGYAFLFTLILSIDLFFIKSILQGNEETGLYTAGQNIARIPFYALSAFSLILFPTISRSIHTESKSETATKIRDTLKYLLLLLIPGTVLIASTSSELLHILYSASYISAAASLSILVFGLGTLTLFNVITYVLIAADKPTLATMLAGLGVVLTSVACIVYIPLYGLIGAALGTSIGAGITMLISFFLVSRRFSQIFPWKSFFKICVAALVMYVCHLFINLPLLLLPVTYLILVIVYGIILIALKEITKTEIELVRNMLPKRIPFITPHE